MKMFFPNFLKISVVSVFDIININATENNKTVAVSGHEKFFLELLSRFLKFEYIIVAPPNNQWGTLKNGKWTGVIGAVGGKAADIGIGKIAITESRTAVVDFSYPYSFDDLTFAVPLPGLANKNAAFLHVFSTSLWITLLTVLVFLAFILQLTNKLEITRRMNNQCFILRLVGYLLQQPLHIKLNLNTNKILLLTWLIPTRIITFSYLAAFLSFLTVPSKEKGVETIEQLSSAVERGTHKCYAMEGAMVTNWLLRSEKEELKILSNYIVNGKWYYEPKKESVLKHLQELNNIAILPRGYLDMDFDGVSLSEDKFVNIHYAIVLKKRFCCKEILNTFLLRMFAAGIYMKEQNDHKFKSMLSSKARKNFNQVIGQKTFSLKDIAGPFSVLITGYALAILFFMFELNFSLI